MTPAFNILSARVTGTKKQRFLNVPYLGPRAGTCLEEICSTLAACSAMDSCPHLSASIELLAIICWPNDEAKRTLFRDAMCVSYGQGRSVAEFSELERPRPIQIKNLGLGTLSLLDEERARAFQKAANAGELLLKLASLDAASPHQSIRRGPSLSKARDLVEASKGANRQRLEEDWSACRDVAHLGAANLALFLIAFSQVPEPSTISLFTPVFADPVSVLGLAQRLQQFGLTHIPHGRREPVLNPETLWQVPAWFTATPFLPTPLTEEEYRVLAERNARRDSIKRTTHS